MFNLFKNFIQNITNKYIANTKVFVTEAGPSGKITLMEFLKTLEERTLLLEGGKNKRAMELMQSALTSQFRLAVKDWELFCNGYSVEIGFSNSISKSEVFSLYISEKNTCPRDWVFRFNNLAV